MRRDEFQRANWLLVVIATAFIVALVIIAFNGCGSNDDHKRNGDHRYSQVYVGDHGYYTRTYDGTDFVWWYVISSQPSQTVPPSLSGWTRSGTPPSGVSPTNTVVPTSGGAAPPSEKTTPEDQVDQNEVTDQDTSEQEAEQASESAQDGSEGDSGDSGDSGGSGGDSGGDSGGGDSGGGDSGGGGDGGGGGDAGGF